MNGSVDCGNDDIRDLGGDVAPNKYSLTNHPKRCLLFGRENLPKQCLVYLHIIIIFYRTLRTFLFALVVQAGEAAYKDSFTLG